MKKLLLIVLLGFVVIVSGCTTGNVIDQSGDTSREIKVGTNIGDKAPDFTVKTIDGNVLKLSEITQKGKPVLLYFFATWCPFCGEDFSVAKNVYPNFENGVEFISVSLDTAETDQVINNYKTKRGYVGEFSPGTQKILRDYNIVRTTTKYAIDKNGIIIYKGSGVFDEKQWETLFTGLIQS